MRKYFYHSLAIVFILFGFSALSQPTLNPTGFSVTTFTVNSLTVSWTNQTDPQRSNYLILANTTGTFVDPTNGTSVTDDTDLGDGTGAININGSDATYNWSTNLSAATVYHFKIFAYKSGGGPLYLTAGAPTTSRTTLATEPSTDPTTITFNTIAGTSLTVNWVNGTSGTDRLVTIYPNSGSSPTSPVDGTTYNANAAYGSGDLLGTGNRVVYKGTGTSVTITGLTPNTEYKVRVAGFNGSGGAENYRGSGVEVTQATSPNITNVSIPNVSMKIGDVVTATITVSDDFGTAHTFQSGNINNFNLGSFTRTTNTTYTATFTVASGGTDVPAGSAVPVANLVLRNSFTLDNPVYSQSITQASDPIDANRPVVSSITRGNTSPTNAASINYTVTFSEGVTGVDVTDFVLTATAAGTINTVTPVSTSVYTVNVNAVSGNGTIRLDVKTSGAGATITDIATNQFQAGFTAGEVYTIDTTVPTVTSIVRQNPTASNTNADAVTFRVTFNDNVLNVDLADFTLSGVATGALSSVNTITATSVFDVVVNPVTGDGILNLDFAAGQNITDAAGNAFGGTITSEEQYTIDNTLPVVFTTGTVTTNAGGNVVSGFYNSTNTGGITVAVPIDIDATLASGTIQVEIEDSASPGFIALGSPVTIPSSNTTQNVSINHATLTGNAKYANGRVLNFRAIITDVAGNNRTGSNSASQLTVDTTVPATPSIPDLDNLDDSGISNTDNITNVTTGLTFTGTSDNNIVIQLFNNVTPVGTTTTANGTGNWTKDLNLPQGTYLINAIAYDPAGNPSVASGNLSLSIPTPPATPGIDLATTSDSGTSNSDNLTNDSSPSITGTATTGDVITLSSNVHGIIGSATAASGTYTIIGRVSKTGTITTSNTLTLVTGTGTFFTTELSVGSQLYNSTGTTLLGTIASITDNLSLTLTANSTTTLASQNYAAGLSNGSHNLTVSTTDVAGNTATSSILAVTIDTQAPTVSSITPSENPTRGIIPRTGTITATTGSATVNGSGTFFMSELFVGAVIRDASGANFIGIVSSIASNTQLTLTANASTAITGGNYSIRLYFTVTFSEVMSSASITTADFVKTGTAAETVIVSVGNVTSGLTSQVFRVSVRASGDGTWRLDKNTDPYTDAAGNNATAAFTGGTAATIDNTGPTLALTQPADNAYVNTAKVTYTIGETLTSGSILWNRTGGTAATDQTVTLTGAELSTNQTDYLPGAAPALVNGAVYEVTFTGADALGNTTTTSTTANNDVTFDTSAPGAFTVGAVVTTGGRVVANYWNGTNTGLNVTVPIANDNSLIGGSLQIQARISTGTFANIGAASTIASDNTNKTVSLTEAQVEAITGYAQGVILQFIAVITDAAGNATTGTQSATTITVDTVAPTISGSPAFDSKLALRETITIVFSETLNLTSGVPVNTTTSGNAGFYADQPAIRNGGATAFTASGITLESDGNGDWDAAVQITYTNSGLTTGNYVRDLAGNEMNTVLFSTNAPAPVLASSMILLPNGTGNENITFTVDQALNIADGGIVTGLTVSGTAFNGIYTLATNTITLTSTSDGLFTTASTVSYTPGNIQGATGTAMVAFANEPILLTTVSITSNNARSASLANVGDVITLNITASSALTTPPVVTIDGVTATVSGVGPYTASITTSAANNTGTLSFSIVADQTGRTTTVTNTINGSSVLFDKTPPTVVISDTQTDNVVRDGDTNFTITATFTDTNGIYETTAPTITIGSVVLNAAMTKTSNLQWTYLFDVPAGNDGTHAISISATDITGNPSDAPTGRTSYTIDNTAPTVSSIEINSAVNTFGTNGTNAGSVEFRVTFSEDVYNLNINNNFSQVAGNDISPTDNFPGVSFGLGSVPANTTAQTVVVTGNGITGTGWYRLNFVDNDAVTDQAGNPVGGIGLLNGNFVSSFTFPVTPGTGQAYTFVLPEPSNPVTNFQFNSSAPKYIWVQWNRAVTPTQQATHYLVMMRKSSAGALPVPTDGTYILPDSDLSDGILIQHVEDNGSPTQFALFNNLNAGLEYNFIIYPYTLSANNANTNINYYTASPLTITSPGIITPTSNFGEIRNVVSNATVSSTADTPAEQVTVLTFDIVDDADGATTAASSTDDAPFKFEGLTVTEGTGDSFTDWSQAILEARLYNGVNFVSASGVNITTNQIIFSAIPSATSIDLGFISDAACSACSGKSYSLRIYLKPSLGGTLPSDIDGTSFVFNINNLSFDYNDVSNSQLSSTLKATQVANSGATNNVVSVQAQKLVFRNPGLGALTDPQGQIGVGTNFPNPNEPKVFALDENNNLDENYSGTISITNTTVLGEFDPYTGTAYPSGGILTLSNFNFTTAGTTKLVVAGTGLLAPATSATSTDVQAVITNLTRITAGPTAEPAEISSLRTSLTGAVAPQLDAIQNFDFTITDDVGANAITFADNDGLPTVISQLIIARNAATDAVLSDWTKIIAGAELSDGVNSSVIGAGGITATSLVFPLNTATLGLIADGTAKTYRLKVWFKTDVDATIEDAIDNKDFVFSVSETVAGENITVTSPNSTSKLQIIGTNTTNSGNALNVVDVDATQIDFTTQWLTNAAQSYDAPLSATLNPPTFTSPVGKAHDKNGNLDLDHNVAATVSTGSLTYPLVNSAVTTLNGIFTFNSGLQVTSAGGGLNNGSASLTLSSGLLTDGVSNTFILNYSGNSDIIHSTFSYPTNILYGTANNQVADITATTGTAMDQFILRDGGSANNDSDGSATSLSTITLRVTNYQNLRKLALYKPSSTPDTEIAEVDVASAAVPIAPGSNIADIIFSGITTFKAADNQNENLLIKASFNAANVKDNDVVHFQVVNVQAEGVSSSFATNNPANIQGDEDGTLHENKIEVIATVIDFTTVPANASINTSFTVIAESRDVNANRDLDYNGAISFSTNGNTSGFATANLPAGPFVSGLLNYPLDNGVTTGADEGFQFTSGNTLTRLTISGAANADSGALTGESPDIDVKSSFESWLYFDPAFSYTTLIPYVTMQEDPLTFSTNSVELARLILSDGGAPGSLITPGNTSPGTPNQALNTHDDADGAFTKITSFTISLTNPGDIRTIALFDNLGNKIAGTEQQNPGATVTFSGLNAIPALTAADDDVAKFYIRASFKQSLGADRDQINIQITNIVWNSGSQFPLTAGTIGGIDGAGTGGDASDATKNYIDAVATKLDFVQQPPVFAGIYEPVPLAGTPVITVHARNQFNVLDTDFSDANGWSNSITTPAAQLNINSGNFVAGVMTLPSLQYLSTGDGTLSITASNGVTTLSSNTNDVVSNPNNVALTSVDVDVINVYTTLATGGVLSGGTTNQASLAGGSVNKVIFGFSVNTPYSITGQPKLNSFTISFSNPIVNVLKNARVFQSTSQTYIPGVSTDVTTLGATVTENAQSILVSFTSPIDLSLTTQVSYFLMVDVEKTSNSGTPSIQPSVMDFGYSDPTTDGNIAVTNGSSYSSGISPGFAVGPTAGNTYNFAAIFPPTLVSSVPANGQLNFDPNGIVKLNFDVPVYSYDQKIYVYDQKTDTLFTEMNALNGFYLDDTGTPVSQLQFQLPTGVSFAANTVYYILIAPGSVVDGKGIADKAKNLFAGITSASTLYFKTSNPNPPLLLEASVTNVTLNGFTLKMSFDQRGKAHYLVLPAGSSGITTSDINNTYPGAIAQDSLTIEQATTAGFTPVYQYAYITPNSPPFNDGLGYDIWIYADNDANPTAVSTLYPYGPGPGFAQDPSLANPTLDFTASDPPGTGIIIQSSTTNICPNSQQVLYAPIALVERNNNDFDDGQGTAVDRTFNLLLPPGYNFDVSLNTVTSQPLYGELELIGSDFDAGSGTLEFLSSSVLQVTFKNSNSASFDIISITGLRMIAITNATTGSSTITRLGGSAFPSVVDGTVFATLNLYGPNPSPFTNTYTNGNTFIPDNFNPDSYTVTLVPQPLDGDYGPSSFIGTGVNLDKLYLKAADLGVTFPITMTHTDNNGCVTETAENYQVYDHTRAIGGLDPIYLSTRAYSVDPTVSTIINIGYKSLGAAFWLENLTIDIPLEVRNIQKAGGQSPQVLDSISWQAMVQALPQQGTGYFELAANQTFYDYYFDLLNINNANGITPNPFYALFEKSLATGETYGTGGSLGSIEITGLYRSVANQLSTTTIVQNVEILIPAVPIIVIPNQPSSIIAPGSVPAYCEQGGLIRINGFPAASAGSSTGTFKIEDLSGNPVPGLTDNENGTAAINPVAAKNGYQDIRITYSYKPDAAPFPSVVSRIIRIVPNPEANFTTDLLCEKRDIQFTDLSTIAGDQTENQITEWSWDFADANSGPNNTSDIQSPIHEYSTYGLYADVQLNVRSNRGCATVNPVEIDLNVGGIPEVVFSVRGVSTNDSFNFNPTPANNPNQDTRSSPNDNIAEVEWDFGDGNIINTLTQAPVPNVTHNYLAAGAEAVTLTVTSEIGCSNSLTKNIVVLPYKVPTDAAVYSESFNSDNGGWQTLTHTLQPSSWVTTNGTWNTGGNAGAYRASEESSLYTPVFNLTGLSRPIVYFLDSVNTLPNDGVALQFSVDNLNITDPDKIWLTIGTDASGIDWYNFSSVAANPGNQPLNQYAFSQKRPLVESKHSLSSIPFDLRDRIVFRFAFASVFRQTDPTLSGFTLDEFKIGSGTRVALFENFTNTSSTGVKAENDIFRSFPVFPGSTAQGTVGVEMVKIDYHIALQNGENADPFNEENPADPGARALFYNISTVPQTRLDGGVGQLNDGPLFSNWGDDEFNRRILDLANATINATVSIADGELTVAGSFTTIDALAGTTVMHVAVIEENVTLAANSSLTGRIGSGETDFNYVLKKMLPNASGTKYVDLAQGVTQSFEFTWTNPKLLMPEDDIAIVIFLQQETGARKVYQSYMVRSADPETITGIDPEKVFGVYPNPADNEFTIELPNAVRERTALKLYDQMGKMVNESFFEKGESKKTIGTSTYAAGVYLIQVDSPDGMLRKKMMIVHKN